MWEFLAIYVLGVIANIILIRCAKKWFPERLEGSESFFCLYSWIMVAAALALFVSHLIDRYFLGEHDE